MWPNDWLYGGLTDRYAIDPKHTLQVRVAGLHRPDFVFYGLGPRSLQSSQSRYAMSLFDASATLEAHAWRSSAVNGTIGLRKVDVSDGHFGGDPSVTEESARLGAAAFPIPYGFDREYIAPYTSLLAVLDTRKPTGSATGVKLEVSGEQGSNVATSQFSGWVRYGATATAFVDLNEHGRVLSFKVGALFSDPLGTQPVPFTELVSLGGLKWMPGYFPNRLVDRSAAVATVAYAWPIAPKFDATIQGSIGNVFGAHLDDFSLSLLRISGALGLTTTLSGEAPVRFLIGLGAKRSSTVFKSTEWSFVRCAEELLMKTRALVILFPLLAACGERRFPLRDPIWRDTDLASVSVRRHKDPTPKDPNQDSCTPKTYASPSGDGLDKYFSARSRSRSAWSRAAKRSTNSLDEVPDSAWFENRIWDASAQRGKKSTRACKPNQILDADNAPDGSWKIDDGKTDGSSGGFRIRLTRRVSPAWCSPNADTNPERQTAAAVRQDAVISGRGLSSCRIKIVHPRSCLRALRRLWRRFWSTIRSTAASTVS